MQLIRSEHIRHIEDWTGSLLWIPNQVSPKTLSTLKFVTAALLMLTILLITAKNKCHRYFTFTRLLWYWYTNSILTTQQPWNSPAPISNTWMTIWQDKYITHITIFILLINVLILTTVHSNNSNVYDLQPSNYYY